MKIPIPKGFFENKSNITPAELLEMFTDMVQRIEKLEEDLNYELETDFNFRKENIELKRKIKLLEEEVKELQGRFSA